MNATYRLFLFCLLAPAMAAVAANPHEISSQDQNADCLACHLTQPQAGGTEPFISKNRPVNLDAYKTDGVEMCSGCHDKEDGHKVGLKLDFDVPADMPLDKKNKLTCLTCHYTHGSLSTNRPQASYSFMDRLVDADRLHKSFLLRRNNAEGELCLTCHDVKKGTNDD